MKGFFATQIAENVPLAIDKVEEVLQTALSSGAHKPFDWKPLGVHGNLQHLRDHVNAFLGEYEGDDEDHLANIACRALFVLQLREEAKKKLA